MIINMYLFTSLDTSPFYGSVLNYLYEILIFRKSFLHVGATGHNSVLSEQYNAYDMLQ